MAQPNDKPTLDRIQLLHPKLRAEALAIYQEACAALQANVTVRFSWTLRTFAEQQALYNQGRRTAGSIVTNAQQGQSYHNYGLAVDIVLLNDKDKNGSYETASWDLKQDLDFDKMVDFGEVISIFRKHGWECGVDWKGKLHDAPHFQKTLGYSIKQLQEKYGKKDFIKGTTYLNL